MSVAYFDNALPAHRSVWGLSHPYFRSPEASDVERAHVNAMQSEVDKSTGEGAGSTIIVFRLAFTSPHKPCRTISNPVQAKTSNVKFKVEDSVNSSKREQAIRAFVTITILTALTYNV